MEMNIQQRLETYPVYENLWQEYAQDQEINDRGIQLDMDVVRNMLEDYCSWQVELYDKSVMS